jgi:hypothetical protein
MRQQCVPNATRSEGSSQAANISINRKDYSAAKGAERKNLSLPVFWQASACLFRG